MERSSWITQVRAIESNESLKAEKFFWLWSERGTITAEGQRDTMSLALKKGKGTKSPGVWPLAVRKDKETNAPQILQKETQLC